MTDRQAWIGDFGGDGDAGDALEDLPDVQRRAYVAVELNGVPLPEHAAATGRKVTVVRSALRQAREQLGGGRA